MILSASKIHTDEAAMNVIPSGTKYWSDTCCCNVVIYKKLDQIAQTGKVDFFFFSLPPLSLSLFFA